MSGCTSLHWKPAVDPYNDPNAGNIQRDFTDCKKLAENATGYSTGLLGFSGYMDRLLSNPRRMAMLSGGLAMMDPNNSYDEQGFYNPSLSYQKGLSEVQAGNSDAYAYQGYSEREMRYKEAYKYCMANRGHNVIN